MAPDYKADLQKATANLDAMMKAAELLQVQIAKQKQVVAALTQLAELTTPADLVLGVTEAVRIVLMSSAFSPLGIAEVSRRIQAFKLPPQQNLLASVHTTLRRLVEAGEVERVEDGYRMKAPIPNPPFSPKLGYTRLTGKRDSK